jgi:RecJ-like exonuclease
MSKIDMEIGEHVAAPDFPEREKVPCEQCEGSGYYDEDEICLECEGSGEVDAPCESCEDTGVVGRNRIPCAECDYWVRREE